MVPYIRDLKVSGVFVVVIVVALPNFLYSFVVSPNSLASINDFDTRSNQSLCSPGNHNIIKNYFSSSLAAPFFFSNTNKSNDSQLTDSILQDKK